MRFHKLISVIVALAFSGSLVSTAGAVTYDNASWDGSVGTWSNSAHWRHDQSSASGSYPNNTSYNALIASGAVYCDYSGSINALIFSGGATDGAGSLTMVGASTWSGGSLGGAGTFVFNAPLTMGANSGSLILARNLRLNDITTWTQGNIAVGTATIINNGTLHLGVDGTMTPFATQNTIYNNGLIIRDSGSGSTSIGVPVFVNPTGSFACTSGQLDLAGGGTFYQQFNVGAGATISFSSDGGTFNSISTTGAGTILFTNNTTPAYLSYGSFNNAVVNIGPGALLCGTGSATISNRMVWTGGQLGFGTAILGGINVASTGTLLISSAGSVSLLSMLQNSNVGTWSAGKVAGESNSIFRNLGQMTITADNLWKADGNFLNYGALYRNVGIGSAEIDAHLTNTGSVTVNSGSLIFAGGMFDSTGTYSIASSATLNVGGSSTFSGGSIGGGGTLIFGGKYSSSAFYTSDFTIDAAHVIINAPNVLNGYSQVTPINSTLTFNGDVAFNSGNLGYGTYYSNYASGTVAFNGNTVIDAPIYNVVRLRSEALVNNGTLSWNSGTIDSSRSTLINHGTFIVNAGTSALASGGGSLNNSGLLLHPLANTTTFGSAVYNTGTVNISAGTLVFGGADLNGQSTGTFLVGPSSTVEFHLGTHTLLPTASIRGGGALLIDDGTLSINGATLDLGAIKLTHAYQTANIVAAAGSHASIRAESLSIDSTSTVDLNDNPLSIHYGAAASPVSTIRGYLVSGFNGGRWNGTGIRSSSALAGGLSLGYVDTAVINVPNIDANTLYIRATVAGDANLDGKVDIADLGLLATHWQATGANWYDGDFDYDGKVTIGDLGELATNWQGQVPFGQALAALHLTDVPEPIVLLPLLCVTAPARRRAA